MLFGCLMALLVWSVFQIFLPPGPVQNTIFSLLGSILFSAYIVYDTDNLIQRKCSAQETLFWWCPIFRHHWLPSMRFQSCFGMLSCVLVDVASTSVVSDEYIIQMHVEGVR